MKRASWLLVLVLGSAVGASAQSISFTPSSPTPAAPITASFTVLGCPDRTISTVIVGNVVRTTATLTGCGFITPAPVRETATFGPLPIGLYTFELYVSADGNPPVLAATTGFAVQAPPIPTLSEWAMLMMAAALGLVALAAVRR